MHAGYLLFSPVIILARILYRSVKIIKRTVAVGKNTKIRPLIKSVRSFEWNLACVCQCLSTARTPKMTR